MIGGDRCSHCDPKLQLHGAVTTGISSATQDAQTRTRRTCGEELDGPGRRAHVKAGYAERAVRRAETQPLNVKEDGSSRRQIMGASEGACSSGWTRAAGLRRGPGAGIAAKLTTPAWFLVLLGSLVCTSACASVLSMHGATSSPAYANMFEVFDNPTAMRTSSSPVTFRVQCHTEMGWEVCVTGGCAALGYWSTDKALLLRTDPSRYPLWEGVGQLPGGCDVEYKYLIRRRDDHSIAHWESCHNRQVRTIVNEKAVLLVTDPESMTQEELMRQEMVTSNYFQEYTTLSAPFPSTLVFNTARPQEDFKELLDDQAFQRPCALVFCRDSGTEIFVRDYDSPQIQGIEGDEPLLETRPDDRGGEEAQQGIEYH